MTEQTAKKVYPIVVYVLCMLERIEHGADVAAEESHARLEQMLRALVPAGTEEKSADRLIQAALVYWADECLVNSDWSQMQRWQDKTLERAFFNTRRRASDFFERANQAATLASTDTLEVFLLCVALGFRGVYRSNKPVLAKTARGKILPAKGDDDWFAGNAPGGKKTLDDQEGEGDDWQEVLAPARPQAASEAWEQAFGTPDLSVGQAPVAPNKASPGGIDLPPTLAAWAESVVVRCRSGRTANRYKPVGRPESQRDAGPLDGERAMHRAILLLMASSVWATLAVIGYHAFS